MKKNSCTHESCNHINHKCKSKNPFILFLCIPIFIFTAIFATIISQDNHSEHCHKENCMHCEIIKFAKHIMDIVSTLIITKVTVILNQIKKNLEEKMNGIHLNNTLIHCKVQFNE